jgi:hypothetical protein
MITVYSCVTGDYDNFHKTILASAVLPDTTDTVEYVLYTDNLFDKEYTNKASGITWQIRPLIWKHQFCNTRTARFHKVNSHLVAPNSDFSVWVDGSHTIKYIKLWEELHKYIKPEIPVYTFKHPIRTCVYQELAACIKYKKDHPDIMQKQIKRYKKESYPPYAGMVETACVVRRHTSEVTLFNKMWWDEINRGSYRDQLSFNYVARKLNLPYDFIPGERDKSPFFLYKPHKS